MAHQIRYVDWLPGGDGVYYGVGGSAVTQVVPASGITYKVHDGFGSVEEAEAALDVWRARGYDGAPMSPASFFRQEMLRRRSVLGSMVSPYYANALLKPYLHGGWVDMWRSGDLEGPYTYYDINKAYFWAGIDPLPLALRPVEPGYGVRALPMDGARRSGWACIVDDAAWHTDASRLPHPLRGEGPHLVTSEDAWRYRLMQVGRVRGGVSWTGEREVCLAEWVSAIDDLPPKAWKKMTQSYWGVLMQRGGVRGHVVKGGETVTTWRQEDKRARHYLWAILIQRRVMAEVWQAMRDSGGALCYVDSVLAPTSSSFPVGKLAGEWSEDDYAPHGVRALAPGRWAALDERGEAPDDIALWDRHAGVSIGPHGE